MDEKWRSFRDGLYDVSNFGRVRSARDGVNTWKGRPITTCLSDSGYLIFGYYNAPKHESVYVHRAVAEVFLGPVPDGMEVNHKDRNRLNCREDNLEYLTHLDNMEPVRKVTVNDVLEIRRLAASGETHTCIALKFNISRRNVGMIAKRITWRHI